MEKEQPSTRKVSAPKVVSYLLLGLLGLAAVIAIFWFKYFTGPGASSEPMIVPSLSPYERTWGRQPEPMFEIVGMTANETTGTVTLHLKVKFGEKSYYADAELQIRGTVDNETGRFVPWITVKKEKTQ